MNIPPSKKVDVLIRTGSLNSDQKDYIKSLSRVENLTADADAEKPKASASSVVKGIDVFVPLEGLIDLNVERNRLDKESNRLQGLLNVVTKKLENKNFVDRAPEDVVERERKKKSDWEKALRKINILRADLN